ncbi:FAD-binding protein [Bradyrhizobium sp. LjRoot220]
MHGLDADSQPIAGLYAIDNDMASIMGGNSPGAGITLGPALTFGYGVTGTSRALPGAPSVNANHTRKMLA